MKIILRKKFVLLQTFWGPSASGPIQTVVFAASTREPLSAWRDRKKDITESLETSLVHQSSTPASGTTFERPGIACSHRNISNLFHISQDTMVPLISGCLKRAISSSSQLSYVGLGEIPHLGMSSSSFHFLPANSFTVIY